MILQPMQATMDDKERPSRTVRGAQVLPFALPRPSAPWRAYRDMATFKHLLLARLMAWQQTGSRQLRSRQGKLAPVPATVETPAQVDEWHGLHQEEERTDWQAAHQARHLGQAQATHAHQDFSNRFRER